MEDSKQQEIQESVQQISTTPQRFKRPQNYLISLAVIGIALILGIASFGYQYLNNEKNIAQSDVKPSPVIQTSPTPTNSTANWITYRNDKYGFEFKYPNDWKVDDETTFSEIILYGPYHQLPKHNEESSTPYFPFRVTINIKKNSQNFSEKTWAEKNIIFQCSGEKPETLTYEPYSTGEISGVKVKGKPGGQLPNYTIVTVKGDSVWSFAVADAYCDGGAGAMESDPLYQSHNAIVDQILSTFKFTTINNQTLDTSSWKTYTNSKYGYSIKYPSQASIKVIPERFDESGNYMLSPELVIFSHSTYGTISVLDIPLDWRNTKVEKISVDGKAGNIYFVETGDQDPNQQVIVFVPNTLYEVSDFGIRMQIPKSNKETHLEYLKTILSTVEFAK